MSDFIEQEVSVTSPPELSADTPTVSDNLLATEEQLEETKVALAPWLPDTKFITKFIQDETEPEVINR